MARQPRARQTVATTLASPFTAKGTTLSAPSRVEPGRAFECTLIVSNESEERLSGAVAQLQHSVNARLMEGTLAINGRTVSLSLVRVSDGRASVKLPPLPPKSSATVTWNVMVDVPADNGSSASISAVVSAHGASLETSASIDITSNVAFDYENTHYRVDGDNAIAAGELRTVTFHVVNDGTMTAYDAGIEFAQGPFELRGIDNIGDLLPGDARVISATVELVGDGAPVLTPVLVYRGGRHAFAQYSFVRTRGPVFSASTSMLERASEDPLAPTGGRIVVSVSVHNEGERPGAPTVQLELPAHAGVLFNGERTSDCTLVFRSIAPGATESQEVIIDVGPCDGLEIGATIDGAVPLQRLSIPIERLTSILPMQFEVSSLEQRVAEPFDVHLELFSESNCVIEHVDFALEFGPGLSYYPGSLHINGNPFPDERFSETHRLAFRRVDYGAVIALDWKAIASRPTLRGATTAIGASVAWEGQHHRAELRELVVAPQALHLPLDQLPFQVEDGPAVLPSGRDALVEEFAEPRTLAAAEPAMQSAAERGASDHVPAAPQLEPEVQHAGGSDIADELEKLGRANFPDIPVAPAAEERANAVTFTAVPFDPRDLDRHLGLWDTLRKDHPTAFGQLGALYWLMPGDVSSDDAGDADLYRLGYKRLGKLINAVLMRASMEDRPQARPADIEAFRDDAAAFVRLMPETFAERFASASSDQPSFAACFSAYATLAGQQFVSPETRALVQTFATRVIGILAQHDDVTDREWPSLLNDEPDAEADAAAQALFASLVALEGAAA
jgi:hypothetical protein